MKTPRPVIVTLAGIALVTAACGNDDDTATPATRGTDTRTVKVEMRDIAFAPTKITVKRGETIRFVFTNTGKVTHDAFIGDRAAQAEHDKEMQASMTSATSDMAGMDMGHDAHGAGEPAVTVAPGKTAELTHVIDAGGTLEIGCHQPGHYAAGMKVALDVA